MKTLFASVVFVVGLLASGLVNADYKVVGHYQVWDSTTWRAGPIVKLCGLMRRDEDSSGFDYQMIWYTDTGPVLRRGSGVFEENAVFWEDELTPFPGSLLYLKGEGLRLTEDYWTGEFRNVNGSIFQSSQFWIVPLDQLEPNC